MPAECSARLMRFARVKSRDLVANFDGGRISSEGGALLLGAADRAIGLLDRLAACFNDGRAPGRVVHDLRTLLGQRIFGIALGYEDVVDHDELRHDPVLGPVLGCLEGKQTGCAPLAGKSTLNRLEHAPSSSSRYHRIGYDGADIDRLFVDLFIEAHTKPPKQIVLDLDATDDPLHGHQEGRFFHGYYDCHCYLPLYIFCGEHLLLARLRRSNIDASAGAVEEVERIVGQIRHHWPKTQIILRADSGFARDELMNFCEQNQVDYVFGLARNERLVDHIHIDMAWAEEEAQTTGKPTRRFADFRWITRKSWSRKRRVVAKAEHLPKGSNPRFAVTSLKTKNWPAKALYEDLYCARGDMENRIKECQLDLFADRTSAATMMANQLRLWFASFAYVLITALRRIGLKHTQLERATPATIRLKILKIGAQIKVSCRRILVQMASACPWQNEFELAQSRLSRAAA